MSATIRRIELQIMEGYLTLSDGGRKELKQECLNQGEHVYVHVSGLCDNAEGIKLGKDYINFSLLMNSIRWSSELVQ